MLLTRPKKRRPNACGSDSALRIPMRPTLQLTAPTRNTRSLEAYYRVIVREIPRALYKVQEVLQFNFFFPFA